LIKTKTHTDCPDLSLLDSLSEHLKAFFHRSRPVWGVEQVEVDPVRLQSFQASLDLLSQNGGVKGGDALVSNTI